MNQHWVFPEGAFLLTVCLLAGLFAWFTRPRPLRGVRWLPLLLLSMLGACTGVACSLTFYGPDRLPIVAGIIGTIASAALCYGLMLLEERGLKRARALDVLGGRR